MRKGLDPLTTEGSRKQGGRYNPPTEFGALYSSLERDTAIAEVARGLKRRGVEPTSYPEGVYWSFQLSIELEAVLDLTDPDVLKEVNIDQKELLGDDIQFTRKLSSKARAEGYQALLVLSVTNPKNKNLVVFADALPESTRVLESEPVSF